MRQKRRDAGIKRAPLSDETRKKISEKAKGRIAHNKGKKEEIKHIYYTDGNRNIRIPITEQPPEGFYKGRLKKPLSEEKHKQFVEKIKATKLKRYGSSNYNNLEKNKLTKLLRYGNEYFNNHEQTRLTNIEKYGVPVQFGREDLFFKSKDSKPNSEFEQLLLDNNIKIDSREFYLDHKRYDFKCGNNLIEINPFPFHNSTFSPKGGEPLAFDYHAQKTILATESGYRCIHIFDWDDLDKIINLLKPRKRIYARNCVIKEVDKFESKTFLEKYHLQNNARSSIRIGLYNSENKLISIMTFDKPRYNKKYEYELVRYCSSYQVVGGEEKLFNYFIKTYNPKSIVSYCDLSKFLGNIYVKLGFKYISTSISKHWYNPKTEQHITDNLLRQRGFDQLLGKQYGYFGKGTSNEQLMLEHGFIEIYDAGQATYSWNY